MKRAVMVMLAVVAVAHAQELNFSTFVEDVGNLDRLAARPAVPYTAAQFSSYDRRSVSPADQSDKGWYANGDQGQFLRVDERDGKKEFVMADTAGPGVITRIWSADPKGVLRIYVDGAEKPVIEDAMETLLGGGNRLAPPPLAGKRSMGWSWHLPIPYAKHLKVTVSEKQLYYHVNVRTYPADTKVRPFSLADVDTAKGAVEAAINRLTATKAPEIPAGAPGRADWSQALAPGGTETLALPKAEGVPQALTVLRVHLTGGKVPAAAWRGVVLRGQFDGETTIEVPLSDFFGAGPGLPTFDSLPCGQTADGWGFSRWVMPWANEASLEFANLGTEPVQVGVQAMVTKLPAGAPIRHFHANWRQDRDVRSFPHRDWNALTVEGGGGVYVGCALFVANPVKEWWGEGDEKFFVDGEAFPSTFGTGTEDFFGYAWCCNERFVHALHGQPQCDGPANYGRTAVYRWQLADCVPWTKGFRFELEMWHWRDCVMSQSMSVYWYGDAGATAKHAPLVAADQLTVPTIPELKVKKVDGAIEGESLKVLEKVGDVAPQELDDQVWSGGAQLWWRAGKPGDKLVLGFTAPAAGKFHVHAVFTKARDYGVDRLSINGVEAGGPRDFHDPRVVATPEQDLGVFDLVLGENRFAIEITGKNKKALPGYMFGLDYLRLEKAQ